MSGLAPILAGLFLCSLVALSKALNLALLNDCSCLRSFRPVCGMDRQTYDNICFLHCAKRSDSELRLAYEGVCCPSAELCTDYVDTVCDQFGNRYENDCVFEFHKCIRRRRNSGEMLRIVGRGERMCQGKRRVTAIDSFGTSSTTNPPSPSLSSPPPPSPLPSPPPPPSHSLSTSTVRKDSSNFSSSPQSFSCEFLCDDVVAPVCDSQGQTHQNRCKFDMAICRLRSRGIVSALHVLWNGLCRRDEQQFDRSPLWLRNPDNLDEYKEPPNIVATTATNSADLRQQSSDQNAADQSSDRPFIASVTFLQEESQRPQNAQKELGDCDFCRAESSFGQTMLVCDNTNLTHQNLCSFAQWNCGKRARGAEERILVHLGECNLVSPIFELKDEKCPTKCSRHYKSVCDSNGLSHPNLCAYQMHSCHQRKNGRPFGWLLSLHECHQQNGTNAVPTEEATGNDDDDASFVGGGGGRRNSSSQNNNTNIECPAEPMCEGTDQQDGPICDSRGRLHNNTCLFAHAHCLAAKEGQQLLRIVSNEHCERLAKPPEAIAGGDATDKSDKCDQKWTLCRRKAQSLHGAAEEEVYCGTDFTTYRTLCDLQMAQCLSNKLEVLFKGPCEQCLKNVCPPTNSSDVDDSHFVCDQNGETLSRCEFDTLRCVMQANLGYNVTFAYQGKCCPSEAQCPPPPPSSKRLPNLLNGVCDSNGRRHRSRCLFEVAKCRAEKIERQPKPLEERYCPLEELRRGAAETTEEWGGGEGTEVGAETTEDEAKENWTKFASKESVPSTEFIRSKMNVSADLLSVDHLICNEKYDPVCGSDKRTYRNACHLERRNATGTLTATQRRWPADATVPSGESDGWTPLKLLYAGECCPTVDCPSEYAPICDSEGRTHLNLCEFGYQRCLAERMRARNVTIAFYGLCPESNCPRGPCPGLFEPVCATNGKNYLSLCELDRTVCVLRNAGGGTAIAQNGVELTDSVGGSLGLDYIGECCESSVDCSDLLGVNYFQPLCDSRGITHADECAFRKAKCQSKRRREPFILSIVRRGQCPGGRAKSKRTPKS
uniref:Kazal-like domain-containing protein n=1 Tax=Globodera rostochiensis TaxID=31243 RepID=A0A914GTX2_GLORO